MKTILIVNWYSTSEGVKGGCETVMDNLQKILQEAGHKAEIVTFQSAMKALNMPIPIQYLRYAIIDRAIVIGRYLEQYEEMNDVDVVIGFDGCLSFYKPDKARVISYLNNPYKDIQEWLWENTNQNLPQAIANYLEFGNVYPMLQERDLQIAYEVIVPSDYMADYVKRMNVEYSMDVILHGIDTKLFKPMDKPEMRSKYLNDVDLSIYKAVGVWNGAFNPVKNWEIMAELIRKHQDIFWIIIMKHPEVSEPKLSNLKIFNDVPYDTIPELLNCADFYISVSEIESFGLCGIEAASCDLPVISTRTGIFKGWNPDNIGRFPDTSIDSISTAINGILKGSANYTPRKEIIDSGFTLEAWKKKWLELIDKI